MADRKGSSGVSSRLSVRRKEKAENDAKKEEKSPTEAEKPEVNGKEVPMENGEAGAAAADGEKPEPIELPPFETITGDRMDPFFFKFQFKNVEYSSGRNKTFLCYLVDHGGEGLMRGYIEDEHAGGHAEEAFFQQILTNYDPACKYTITWYMSSSPCANCATKLAEILRSRKNIRLAIFSSRLFEWEEPEIQAGLKLLASVGCKLRMMKPLDFTYTWDTFVESDEQQFTPWEDCQENYEYYQDKLADILQ
ncbi:C-_U-editing enzyme APOBEC-2a [Danio rerio]|uniref:mRNA(cytosine(6666)) deaminase n=1 Tax=Danio rerio TaxID=7955 RepID=Q5CZQ2_DANRE|nr:C->U-editing enzyme APOBEC-2a [Danio rerio]AAH90758.1 Zgc:110762 [Danio rerio]AAI65110.1 Zgc:110762 protein [Danio rerio]ACS66877.1 apolipoprotein B-editing catalytic subunit 2a [Danio rerio]|eukprot:NP_001013332.1 apolipoprotein B mRNA editing enzyme, catalytic polypeptide-like 2a [Danio rerio]